MGTSRGCIDSSQRPRTVLPSTLSRAPEEDVRLESRKGRAPGLGKCHLYEWGQLGPTGTARKAADPERSCATWVGYAPES